MNKKETIKECKKILNQIEEVEYKILHWQAIQYTLKQKFKKLAKPLSIDEFIKLSEYKPKIARRKK